MSSNGRPNILAIVVTFHPDSAALIPLLQTLSRQVTKVLVVDNSDGTPIQISKAKELLPNIEFRSQGRNTGIAEAQNVGIRMAIEHGYDYVLLSDQDSLPDPDMVSNLSSCEAAVSSTGLKVGCVCPEYFDRVSGQTHRFQVPGTLFYRSVVANPASPCLEIVTGISSGSLISRSALEVVGNMREDFFIDHVDTEWCHRARANGYRNFGAVGAKLTHALGQHSVSTWFFGWRQLAEYPPIRLYYRIRNFILMCRLPHVPLLWSARASLFWLANVYAQCLFGRRRFASTRAIALGLWDGLLGRSGPADREI